MWIRNQEVTLGEAEGRERSREIGRQRETGGLGGEKERHRVGREEWFGWVHIWERWGLQDSPDRVTGVSLADG